MKILIWTGSSDKLNDYYHHPMHGKTASDNENIHPNCRIYSFEQIVRPDLEIFLNVQTSL